MGIYGYRDRCIVGIWVYSGGIWVYSGYIWVYRDGCMGIPDTPLWGYRGIVDMGV